LAQLIVIVAMLVLLWLLLIRPARRRQVAQQELLQGIEVDDEILTAGGIYGHVREIADDELLVEVAPDVTLRMARRAVAAVIPPEDEVPELEQGDVELEEDAVDAEEGSPSANPNETDRG
jgi:preprotein translocase subunit YajC